MSDGTDVMLAQRIADEIATSGGSHASAKAVEALAKGFRILDEKYVKVRRARNELARIADKMASGGNITAKEINSIAKLAKS